MLKLGQNYDLLCNMIIRPPRFIYDIADLGPRHFSAGGKPAQRTDFELRNGRGMIIQCSHFEPLTNWDHPMPCVIYLHGNGGCRIEALDVVHTLLPVDVSVLALDFAGSGLSEGEYVSLGFWEQHDVATVVHYLRDANRCSTIGLWGRSMGAVTAILYSMQDPSIASMVLDSPFCSLQKIAEDLVLNVETLQKVPRFTKFAVGLAMKPIRSTIKKKAKFDIKALEVMELVSKCFIPALFIHGRDDNFVLPMHSELLILVDGNHNSMRPNFFMDSAVIFFNNTLHNGEVHVAPKASTLPELPPSLPQHQAAIQLQQFNGILHPHNANHALAQVQAQVTPQAHAQAHAHAQANPGAQGVVMEEIDVNVEPLAHGNNLVQHNPTQNTTYNTNGLHGSVIIDDMVIGNTVMIDGREVILDSDQDQDAYYSETSTPLSSLSTTPTTTLSTAPINLSSTPPSTFLPLPATTMHTTNDEYPQHTTNNTTNNAQHVNHDANDMATNQDTSHHPPTPLHDLTHIHQPTPPSEPHNPSQGYIVHDNADDEVDDEIPEEIETSEGNTAPTLSFRAEADIPQDTN